MIRVSGVWRHSLNWSEDGIYFCKIPLPISSALNIAVPVHLKSLINHVWQKKIPCKVNCILGHYEILTLEQSPPAESCHHWHGFHLHPVYLPSSQAPAVWVPGPAMTSLPHIRAGPVGYVTELWKSGTAYLLGVSPEHCKFRRYSMYLQVRFIGWTRWTFVFFQPNYVTMQALL